MPSNARILAAMAAMVSLIIVGLLNFNQIIAGVILHLGGASLEGIMSRPAPRDLWSLVLLNTLLVSLFLVLVPWRPKGSWRGHGAYAGFMISLFSEMYGLPLTVFFLSGAGYALFEPQFLGYVFVYGHLIGSPLVIAGILFLYKGWKEVFFLREEVLVKVGIYSTVRHPQYLGLILVTLGHLLTWPTIPTIVLWPVLTALYYRQAKREDAHLSAKFGDAFAEYARKTPMFLPRIDWRRLLRSVSH